MSCGAIGLQIQAWMCIAMSSPYEIPHSVSIKIFKPWAQLHWGLVCQEWHVLVLNSIRARIQALPGNARI
jgi:hypothetical protein